MVGEDGEEFDGPVMFSDPDVYKEDWVQSFVYKNAMKAEAIKRGEPIDSDFECEDDEDKVEMTVTHYEDKSKIIDDKSDGDKGAEENASNDANSEVHMGNAQDVDDIQGNNIGFMKSFAQKGGIKMLSENEIFYLKTFLKQQNEKWDSKSVLNDLFRHCKFTIRKLTRRMANIDNH